MSGDNPNNSNAKSAFELWKSGVRLDRAPAEFGMTRQVSRIRRQARSDARVQSEIGKANFRKISENAEAIFAAITPFHASFNENTQVRIAMKDHLFERLRTGDLVAYGFPVHNRDAATPEEVPIFLLNRDCVKWHTREFVGYDRHYADVTITEYLAPAVSVPPEPKKIGAPSFAGQLELIARELAKRKITLDGKPLKLVGEHYRQLGMELALPMINNSRPSNETVRRFIASRPDTKN